MKRIGPLDQRLTIQTPNYASSTQSGQGVASWSTLATVWGSVTPMNASEGMTDQSITSQATYEIEIRHRSDVTPKHRIQWTPYSGTARTFEIHGVTEGDRRADRLLLTCGEVT